jgi:hypothetical protein
MKYMESMNIIKQKGGIRPKIFENNNRLQKG